VTEVRCRTGSVLAGEPMAGTAPRAVGWVAFEQSGPWGAKAFTESHLHPEIGAAVETACKEHGLRPALIRRPGRHPDHGAAHSVLLAHTSPGRSWMLEGRVTHPHELLGLDWLAVTEGDQEAAVVSLPGGRVAESPALLVCTNGSRDRCCAIEGRQVALAAHRLAPGRVWETTHLSGHRFSATAVALPSGQVLGRLTAEGVSGLIEALQQGRIPIGSLRGRSIWSPREQVAEIVVRQELGEDRIDAIVSVEPSSEPAAEDVLTVRHQDGRTWQVEVRSAPGGVARSESCGKPMIAMAPLRGRVLTSP